LTEKKYKEKKYSRKRAQVIRKKKKINPDRLSHIDDYREKMMKSNEWQTDAHYRSNGGRSMSNHSPGVEKAYTPEEKRNYAIAMAREEDLLQKPWPKYAHKKRKFKTSLSKLATRLKWRILREKNENN
jgi:hypothetical protein